MTLQEELEILRGEPIQVFTGDPMDIPCIETSDSEKLCKNPVVSVNMITYNHEPYIRQAIEGVMMQKTDFEFELVIGEDCSTDKTREICFEYQKRYPEKIRVLWWHENLRKVNHPAGMNGRRNLAHCRGEFIAFCEGDDYWIDPLKLQKQVDVMRTHLNVGLIYCGSETLHEDKNLCSRFDLEGSLTAGLMLGCEFVRRNVYGVDAIGRLGADSFLHTATVMVRRVIYEQRVEILDWRLRLADVPLFLSCALRWDVYYLRDVVSVYRLVHTGAVSTGGDSLWRDNLLTRLYFARVLFHSNDVSRILARSLFRTMISVAYKRNIFFWSWFSRVRGTEFGAAMVNALSWAEMIKIASQFYMHQSLKPWRDLFRRVFHKRVIAHA